MSKINRGEPRTLDELQKLIEDVHNGGRAVVFTDNTRPLTDYKDLDPSKYYVIDLTVVKQLPPEVQPASTNDQSVKQQQQDGQECPSGDYIPTPDQQKLRDALQKCVGDSLEIEVALFRNWGLTETAIVFVAYPKKKRDITKLIKGAKENNLSIRSVGAAHSWSKIHADDRTLVLYMNDLQSDYPDEAKIRRDAEDRDQVDIMAGVTTGDFMDFQLANDLYIPANVILDVVTMVGVVATGCHGVGWDAKTPGDHITRMRIFDSDGTLREYTNEDNNMMKAISANFGTFGIIYDVTIKLQGPSNVSVQNKYMPMRSLMEDATAFKKLIEDNWSVELFWFPYNSHPLNPFSKYDPMEDDLLLRLINDTTEPVEGGDNALLDFVGQVGLLVATPLYRDHPRLTPLLAKAAFWFLQKQYKPDTTITQQLPCAVHYRKFIHLTPVQDMEFVFDLKDDYNKVINVIQKVIDVMTDYNEKKKFPLNVALEMRWMAYGGSYLTPAIIGNPAHGGSGHVFYIEVLSVVATPHWEAFCIDVAKKWMELGGIPHLAKEWQYIPGIHKHIHEKVGDQIDKFKEQLEKSGADPDGMFLNESLKKLLDM